jgi:SAM-dependent methyltransferase
LRREGAWERADARARRWLARHPGTGYRHYYAHLALRRIEEGRPQPSLGPGWTGGDGRQELEMLVSLGLRPGDTLVDYGCGTLRVGRLLIEYLERGRYWGLDVDEGLLESGRQMVDESLLRQKAPHLGLIGPETIAAAAEARPGFVCAFGVLQHVHPDELDEFMSNVAALLTPGATALLLGLFSVVPARTAAMSWTIGEEAWLEGLAARGLEAVAHDWRFMKKGAVAAREVMYLVRRAGGQASWEESRRRG